VRGSLYPTFKPKYHPSFILINIILFNFIFHLK
jgi:hypothetical protein